MGEIDIKPIESVQSAITFFGQSNEQRKNSPTDDKEVERELASVRVQLEAKEAVHKQALVKLDHYQKSADELSTLLKNSDVKKNFYINKWEEAISRVAELESALAEHDLRKAKEAYKEANERELEKAREEEKEAQVEIALLKFQLHKGRSKLAAAEAAEARAQSEKTALYNALQQMGLEAEETKKENRMLKEAAKSADEAEQEELILSNKELELEDAKRDLEAALSKIGELRTRAEQATSRADAAEKAKAALEDQNKRRREHKEERRKAALAALRLQSMSTGFVIKDDDHDHDSAKIYQPLGKVLNMKF